MNFLFIINGPLNSHKDNEGGFINKELFNKVGGYNQDYKFFEDTPMLIDFSQLGELVYCTNIFTVLYRLHDSNVISSLGNGNFVDKQFFRAYNNFIYPLINPLLFRETLCLSYFKYLNYILVTKFKIALGNKRNSISKLLNLLIILNLNSNVKRIINKI